MLAIIATLNVKPGLEAEFEKLAAELAEQVNANEPGCLLYAVFHGEAPGFYHFVETYVDQAAVDAHRTTAYAKQFSGDSVTALLAGPPTVQRMKQIAARDGADITW